MIFFKGCLQANAKWGFHFHKATTQAAATQRDWPNAEESVSQWTSVALGLAPSWGADRYLAPSLPYNPIARLLCTVSEGCLLRFRHCSMSECSDTEVPFPPQNSSLSGATLACTTLLKPAGGARQTEELKSTGGCSQKSDRAKQKRPYPTCQPPLRPGQSRFSDQTSSPQQVLQSRYRPSSEPAPSLPRVSSSSALIGNGPKPAQV